MLSVNRYITILGLLKAVEKYLLTFYDASDV